MNDIFSSSILPNIAKKLKRKSMNFSIQDIIGIIIIGAILPIAFVFEVTFVFSFWFTIFSMEWFMRVTPLCFFALNAYLNIFQTIRVGSNGSFSSTTLPSILKPGFKFCYVCNINSPPRSQHCPVCKKCVFRRDHHCSFLGTCIGHFNQKYFIGAICNLWIVSLVCCIYNWNVLWGLAFSKFNILHIWQLMFPHLAYLFGFTSFFQFYAIFAFISSAITFVFKCYLVLAQVFCFWRGQTRVEYLLDVHAYNFGSFFENVRECLGSRWPLILISPFLDTRLSSDGVSFRTKDLENVNKTLKNY